MHDAAQVAVSTNKEVDAQMPNYQSLPAQLICQLHNVTMHVCCLTTRSSVASPLVLQSCSWILCFVNQADIETDEVYAQMTLQPLTAVCHLSLSHLRIPYFALFILE